MHLPPLVSTDANPITLALLVIGIYVSILSLVSFWYKERLYIPTTLICTCLGMAAGPYGLNWIDPRGKWMGGDDEGLDRLTFEMCRIVIGVQVMFAGLDLPRKYVQAESLSLAILLLPIMTVAWFVSGAFIYLVVPPLSLLESLCIGACVTPTDPVLANAIVRGGFAEQYVPERVRHLISAESGANDGLGYPFLYIALLLMRSKDIGPVVWHWIVQTWIYQILLSIVIGALVGYLASVILTQANKHGLVDDHVLLVYSVGLAFLLMGILGVIGSDDILACFVAGSVLDYFSQTANTKWKHAQDSLDFLLDTGVFIYLGSIFRWSDYTSGLLTPWRVVVLCIAILCLRRPPWIVIVSKAMSPLKTTLDVAFTAWFGPIGVSAIYYAILAYDNIDPESRGSLRQTIVPLVLAIALSSIIVHGLTVPLVKLSALPFQIVREYTITTDESKEV